MAPHAEEPSVTADGNGVALEAPAASSHGHPLFDFDFPGITSVGDTIETQYTYRTNTTTPLPNGRTRISKSETVYDFKLDTKVPKVGVMLVGWGGNNGSTVTAGIIANRNGITWETKEGIQEPNYYGSLTMASTITLGTDSKTGLATNVPFHDVLPMVHPNDLVIGGWDISQLNLADAMDRAQVLEPGLKSQIRKEMASLKPLPSIYYPDFIAANQEGRADNLIPGSKASNDHVEQIRKDIENFKTSNGLDKVIVQWTANTERFADIIEGVNDTAENLLKSIKEGHEEVAPSTVFAVACILENVPFINGSPQNTFVPGAIQLAEQHGAFIGGDDFKSGQTKMKSSLVDFLINAGIKVKSIASYNHLGNNDGKNLSAPAQFRSKEISKSNVVDDMVAANTVLYKQDEHPDHAVVIKYLPAVGDDKRAMDEYFCEIFMGGHQAISIYNVCEDSLLASPLIIDLVLITELMTRVQWRRAGEPDGAYQGFHSVLSILSYMLKAPLTPPGTPVVNSLTIQRGALTNIFRALIGLEPQNDMTLEHKIFSKQKPKV